MQYGVSKIKTEIPCLSTEPEDTLSKLIDLTFDKTTTKLWKNFKSSRIELRKRFSVKNT